MKKKFHEDIWICLIIYAFCLFMFLTGRHMHFPDSKYFPFLCLGLMCLMNTVLLGQTIWFSLKHSNQEVAEANAIKWKEIRFPLLVWLVLLAYVVLFDFFGFYISTVVMTVGLLLLLKVRNWKIIAALPVALLAGVYILFEVILKVTL